MAVFGFDAAKATQARLHEAVKLASAGLDRFPKGPTGITPGAVKFSGEFRVAKRAFDVAFEQLRAFNAAFSRTFRTEIRAARAAKMGRRG
jgi:hypothetical protein